MPLTWLGSWQCEYLLYNRLKTETIVKEIFLKLKTVGTQHDLLNKQNLE